MQSRVRRLLRILLSSKRSRRLCARGRLRSTRRPVTSLPSLPSSAQRRRLSPASAQEYGADPFVAQGVLVSRIEGGFAQQIGVQAGDFIREVNGQKITDTAGLAAVLLVPARSWTLVIEREGQIITARFSG